MSRSNSEEHLKCPHKLKQNWPSPTVKSLSLSLSHTHTHTHMVHLQVKMIDLVIQVTFQSNREEHEPVNITEALLVTHLSTFDQIQYSKSYRSHIFLV